jgi:hypothetical protein
MSQRIFTWASNEGGKSTGSFFQPVQRKANDDGSGTADSPDKTEKGEQQDCTGWESDPQSFCTKVARHFLQTEFGKDPQVTKVGGFVDGGCRVQFEDGTVITVQKLGNQKVFVQVSSASSSSIRSGAACYDYVCFVSGKLELTKTPCK